MRDEAAELQDILTEREKELDCVYALAREFSRRDLPLSDILSGSAAIIRAALRNPDVSFVRISVLERDASSGTFPDASATFSCEIPVREKHPGILTVGYSFGSGGRLLDREEKLIQSVASLLSGVIELRLSEARARKSARSLRRKNLALREVLTQIELEKRDLKDQVSKNIERFVLPIISRLSQSGISGTEKELIDILASQVKDLTSSFGRVVAEPGLSLSPRETEICGLIRGGLNSKDIARVLNISLLTVERHRHNIRKKLGIDGSDVNLSTFLRRGLV
jgi:DNA-binding CsgD family transcriptional regulator